MSSGNCAEHGVFDPMGDGVCPACFKDVFAALDKTAEDNKRLQPQLNQAEIDKALDAKLLDNVRGHWEAKCLDLQSQLDECRAELEQSQDIRSDMSTDLAHVARVLEVSNEPHQSWHERFHSAVERAGGLRLALKFIDTGQCERRWSKNSGYFCHTEKGWRRDAEYSDEKWCNSCIAHEALAADEAGLETKP